MNKLPKRLQTIADLVDKNTVIADIGCDHGWLPIYLCLNNKIKKAYACDVAKMPLSKAQENVKKYNLDDNISFLLCDGLSKLNDDVDQVIIAGMGGHLIAKIIDESPYQYNTYILQPNTHHEVVREQLVKSNYRIIDEKMIVDQKKTYVIIKAQKSNDIIKYSSLEIKYGPILMKTKTSEFISFYANKYEQIKKVFNKLSIDNKDYDDLKSNLIELKNLLYIGEQL